MSDNVLANVPHIVENILKHLSANDLCRCAMVCKLWNSVATKEIENRRGIVHFLQVFNCTTRKDKRYSIRGAGKFEKDLHAQFHALNMKPAFCIAFANSAFWDMFEHLFPSHPSPKRPNKRLKKIYDDDSRQKYIESVIKTTFKNHLPSTCKVSFFIGSEIISSDRDKHSMQKPIKTPAVTGYLISELPGNELQICKRQENGADVLKFISNQSRMRSALALAEHKYIPYLSIGLKELKSKFDIFATGVVFPVEMGSSNVPIFSGDSLDLLLSPGSGNNAEQISSSEIRNKKFSPNNTMVFAFSDGDDDDQIFRNCNYFLKMFPDIPIVGLYGKSAMDIDGQKDIDFVQKLVNNHVPKLEYGYKFLLISIDNL